MQVKARYSHPSTFAGVYLSIYISNASSPPGNLPQGSDHGRVVSSSPSSGTLSQCIPYLPTCSLSPILFHPIYPLHWWSPPYSPSLNCALIYFFVKSHSFIHSHHMSIPPQCVSLHPLNHSTVHSHCCFTHTTPPIRVLITFSIPP